MWVFARSSLVPRTYSPPPTLSHSPRSPALTVPLLLPNSAQQSKSQESSKQAEKKPPSENTFGEIYFFYGSQSGTAAKYSNILAEEAEKQDFIPRVIDLQDFTPELLKDGIIAVFLMATHGEGEPTDNSVKFYSWLRNDERANDELATLRFSVFGLGNTQYEKYNLMGRETNRLVTKLGAKR